MHAICMHSSGESVHGLPRERAGVPAAALRSIGSAATASGARASINAGTGTHLAEKGEMVAAELGRQLESRGVLLEMRGRAGARDRHGKWQRADDPGQGHLRGCGL